MLDQNIINIILATIIAMLAVVTIRLAYLRIKDENTQDEYWQELTSRWREIHDLKNKLGEKDQS